MNDRPITTTRVIVLSQHLPDAQHSRAKPEGRERAAPSSPEPVHGHSNPIPQAGWDALVGLVRLLARQAAHEQMSNGGSR
jgi:hypothetical protein